jgi:Leucine-rich repeat (LRR) protein
MEEDLALFTELHSLNVSENALPFEKLGVLPNLRSLQMAYNQVQDISGEALSRFLFLEDLDLSFNKLSQDAITILSVFQNLKKLDLASNKLREFPKHVANLRKWNQSSEERNRDDADPILQTVKPIPGFVKLHTLILENNHLSDPSLFWTLKDMPW